MRIHLAIQYPLTGILSRVRKNASRHLQMPQGVLEILSSPGACEALCEMELFEQFKQSAQALELLHERKMWNEQKTVLSERSEFTIFANAFPHLE